MSVRVKICGLTTEAAVEACAEAGCDWAGFVFFERSPRHLTAAHAQALIARLPASVVPVGLFVRPIAASIAHVLADVPLRALQVYDEPARVAAIRAAFGLETWHALPLAPGDALPASSEADRLVVEGRSPPGADRPGGTGTRLDWRRLRGWRAPVPWMLAGGLDAANVGAAIAATGAEAVDVSSGVEHAPGLKDPGAIRAFVRAARSARAAPEA